jgi:hypothetical protein
MKSTKIFIFGDRRLSDLERAGALDMDIEHRLQRSRTELPADRERWRVDQSKAPFGQIDQRLHGAADDRGTRLDVELELISTEAPALESSRRRPPVIQATASKPSSMTSRRSLKSRSSSMAGLAAAKADIDGNINMPISGTRLPGLPTSSNRFGARLLSRTTRTVVPTEAGCEFLARMEPILKCALEAEQSVRKEGELRMQMPRVVLS